MKKFEFRLQPLLRYREHCENQALQALMAARQQVRRCEEKIAECLKARERKETELDALIAAGMDMARYRWYMDYISGIDMALEAEEKRLKGLLKLEAEKQKDLARKSMDKKILENLKAQKKEQYFSDMLELEHKTADDMILLRKAGKGRE